MLIEGLICRKQWRSKGGRGQALRGAGLGGAPRYFLQSFKNAFKQKFRPKFAKKCVFFERNVKKSLQRWGIRPLDPSVVTPIYYYSYI